MMKNSNRKKNSCDQTRADRITPTRSNHRCWSDLPVDLSRSVAERLIYPDFLRFRAVCKNWQGAFSDDDDLQRRAVFPLIRVDSSHYFHYTKTQTVCTARFFDLLSPLQVFPIRNVPIRNVVQEQEQVQKEDLVYPSFCCSYSGWLLLLKSHPSDYYKEIKSRLFVHNPFRNETLELHLPPSLRGHYLNREVEVAGFSTTPTSPDCVIFLLWKIHECNGYDSDPNYEEWDEFFITTYNRKHRNQKYRSWSVHELPLRNPKNKEWKFIKDVAYVDGSFYCAVDMNSKVVLGTFNVVLQEWVMMMKRSLRLPSRPEQMNLVKSDEGLLLAVCYKEQGGDDFFYHIYQFNLSRKEWTRVKSLGNRVLMLRSCSSVATPAVGMISKLANMIFDRGWDWDSYVAFTWEIEGEWRWRQSVGTSTLNSLENMVQR